MTVIVRDLRPGTPADIEGFIRVRHRALPYVFFSPASVLHGLSLSRPEAHARKLVAVEDGEIIGTAQLGLAQDSPEPGQGSLNVYVDPARTGRGAGTLLVRTAEEHLAAHGATKLFAWVLDEPADRAFAARHGYRSSRSAHFLRLDLARTALPPLQDPRPASSCARPPTSPTTRSRCSPWTRRRVRTNPATSPPSSRTTRPGSTSTGSTRIWTGS